MKSNFATKHKEGIEVTTADYEAYTEAILVAKENYNKLLDTNPEFKNLEAEKQKEVFMASIQKNAQSDLKKIGNCFFSFSEVGECFTEATLGSKIVFGSCVFLTGAADIYAAIQLGAAFVLSIEPVIKGELAFCTELAFTTSVAACIITIQANIIICIANEFGITYNP